MVTSRHAEPLETVSVIVPEAALPAYEAAFRTACDTVGTFVTDEAAGLWRVDGVKPGQQRNAELEAAVAVAAFLTGASSALVREPLEAEGWLARVARDFPEQRVGRFLIRGTHLPPRAAPGFTSLVLDAGIAFGSGEHGSTRGCLRALARVAHLRPRAVADMGCGSGILAIAAAKLLRRPVIAVDVDPWAVRVAAENARLNGVAPLVRAALGDGWQAPAMHGRRFELIFANILARPLCRMAPSLARHMAPGGVAILAGLLHTQVRQVLAAHAHAGLHLLFRLEEGSWTTLVLRR